VETQARFVSGEYRAVVDLLSGSPTLGAQAAYVLGRAHQALQQCSEATAALQRTDTTQARVVHRTLEHHAHRPPTHGLSNVTTASRQAFHTTGEAIPNISASHASNS